VLTAGTFLRGRIHVGTDTRIPAGRAGDPPAIELAEQLEALGLRVARFKTGTPPRVDGRTVDYARTERQDGESPEYRFSALVRHDRAGERPCWITWAAAPVTDIIREHLHSSALYGGEISGRGPRYCPSIEDKVVKFPNAERHQIFLEPEGLGTEELYVNGLSTSLPVDVQEQFLRAVPGLEQVRMTRAGYAIEYDYYPPEQLTPWLAVKALDGLFFAGQINGTTGYEEAAGQGALAGMNAARHAFEQEPIVIGRAEAYIGVLVDDLVTRGVDEPYRLFTSRAEHRLLLRQDNAVKRLMHLADRLDLWTSEETALVDRRIAGEREIIEVASTTTASLAANAVLIGVNEREITEPTRVIDLVRRPRVPLRALLEHLGHAPEAPSEAWISSEIEIKYAGYLERERVAARRLAEMAEFVLPQALPWDELTSLSYEAREKLSRVQPVSLAQAGRIPGVSPSDLQNLVVEVLRRRRVA
jgi:tRNA uridine 5-carboxymethylaminomethyl modification enzyme